MTADTMAHPSFAPLELWSSHTVATTTDVELIRRLTSANVALCMGASARLVGELSFPAVASRETWCTLDICFADPSHATTCNEPPVGISGMTILRSPFGDD